jgi:hypothetical protein
VGSNQSTNAGEEMEIQKRILQANRMYFSLLAIMRSKEKVSKDIPVTGHGGP